MQKLRVYGFPTQNNGCSKYRLNQPLRMLEKLGLAEVRREPDEPQPISAEKADDIFRWADVVVAQPFSELWAVGLMLAARDTHKKKLVVDLDDNIYSVHPLNVSGGKDGQLRHLVSQFSGKFEDFWEVEDIPEGQEKEFAQRLDGTVLQFDSGMKFLKSTQPDIRLSATAMLEYADMVTTTNTTLQDVFRKVTKAPVAVLPNCLDFSEWEQERPTKQGTWLGWCGSVSHYPDLKQVLPALDTVMEEDSTLKFHVMGSSFDYLFPPKSTAHGEIIPGYSGENRLSQFKLEDCGERWPQRMRFDKPVSIQEYVPWFAGNFQADIAIAPLEDNAFNQAKSELKWAENAALGIPTVASKVGPYARTIRHDVDGLLAQSSGSWKKALRSLIEDPEKRNAIGQAAKERVHAEYDAAKRAPEWLNTYEAVV